MKPSVPKKRLGKDSDGKGNSDSKRKRSQHDFMTVAIGASAGGIEATSDLFRALPKDTGMAFVLVQHLDPKHHSILNEIIGKETSMPVGEVTNGVSIEPNHVYVIPPNTTMSVQDHTLNLGPRQSTHGWNMPIDYFMRSLAQNHGAHSIGVILSGSGSDGTLGLMEIQAQGGVTFAQDESAKHDSMPRSAIAAGCVDFVLPPPLIARELERIARHPFVARARSSQAADPAPQEHHGLNTIFQLLRKATGVDFTYYRDTTIRRRIQRRMLVHKTDKLEEYVKYVQHNPSELRALYQDLLINVTSFFRNPSVFDALKATTFPSILRHRQDEAYIRIWAPGCASGEETYSLAIGLLEYMGDKSAQVPIQLFGTDISESSINKARAGVYPENIQEDVSPERLRRFFTKVDGGYRISKTIRDMCIFAQHNLLNDPPFSQMDLICCRNVLIYLEPVLQKKVIGLFHYALRPIGYLVLGSSEGVGSATNLFSVEDRANKIFAKRATAHSPVLDFAVSRDRNELSVLHINRQAHRQADVMWNYPEAQKEFDRRLLMQYSPAAVFVNEELEVVHSRGDVDRYLKLAPGKASLSILKMARDGMVFDLRNALNRAQKENATTRTQGIAIKSGDGTPARRVNFEVIPVHMPNNREQYYMIVFEDARADPAPKAVKQQSRSAAQSETYDRQITKLQQELAATKEYLHSVIESQEATNEELQSANEEILSSNEELQSTNEELETAKEELQSANEELSTVNDELRNRNAEITNINNDLMNLLSSVNIPIVMLDSDLKIRRFTPLAQKALGLIPTDIGRPFTNINPTMNLPDLQSLILQTMETANTIEREVRDKNEAQYLLRLLPYKTQENKIDGVVITLFTDTTALKPGLPIHTQFKKS